VLAKLESKNECENTKGGNVDIGETEYLRIVLQKHKYSLIKTHLKSLTVKTCSHSSYML